MRLLLLLCAAAACPAALAAPPAWVLETKPGQRIEATMTFEVTPPPTIRVREWVFGACEAPELPSQTKVSTRLTPTGAVLKEKGGTGRGLVVTRMAGSSKPVIVTVRYEATLMARKLVPAGEDSPAPVAPLPKAERTRWLATSKHHDHDAPAFRNWLKAERLMRDKDEGDVEFARRVYRHLVKTYNYEYVPDQDRRASGLCKVGKSDCGGLSTLFVGAMRANGVPARQLAGHNAVSGKRGVTAADLQYHVRSEFFADGVGWVPVDVSFGVVGGRTDGHFGDDPGNHLTQHVDPDLVFDLKLYRGAKPVEMSWLQGLGHWYIGEGSGALQIVEDWQVKKLK
jgi:transglutaminase-like putative cysteine protease